MMHESKEEKTENARIHELSEMIGEDEINRWAKWNIVRKVTSLIISMLLLLVFFFHNFDNASLLALPLITLALLLSFEIKEHGKRRNLFFTKIIVNGQTKLLRTSSETELSAIKYKTGEALNLLLLWKNATRFYNAYYAAFDVIIQSFLLPILIASGIFLVHSMLSTLLDLTIPLDWAYNSQTLIIPTLTMLLLAASFYEAKLSKPIHKKILSLKW